MKSAHIAFLLAVAVSTLATIGNARAQLYAMGENFFTGPTFGTINPVTGAFTHVSDGTFANGYYAMTFDPLTNSFYTTNASIDSGGFASQIKQINATTGATTILQINDTPTSSILIGGVGFDSTNGKLYAMGENFFTGPTFGTIDPVTGAFTHVSDGTFANGYYAMTFDPLTNSFYTTNASIDSGGFASQIKQINATTGATTILQINDTPTSSILIGGVGFDTVSSAVPEPSTWAMMLVGFAGLGFAFRQSRRRVSLA